MIKLSGVPASPGIASGKAFLHKDNDLPEIPRYILKKDQVEAELKRLETAYEAAEKELSLIHEKTLLETGKEQADIFAAHILMLQDPEIREQVKKGITETLNNAEWAVWENSRSLARLMAASADPLFRERVADINDISKRLLYRLLNISKRSLSELDRDVIIAANDLLPSEILMMNKIHVKGLAMEQGGRTSHIAILARAFNIPAVLGLSSALEEIANDDELLVDGYKGEVFINPGKDELKKYRQINNKYFRTQNEFEKLRDLPAETIDGRRVMLKANIEIPEEAETALNCGAMGIGLYRSEFLFLSSGRAAGEEAQFEAYSRVLKTMGELPVTIRTVDIGGDKILAEFEIRGEKNPLLGWRAIRLSLSRPELFKTQLRAILRAAVNGNARIMFPLISGMEELEQALFFLEEAKAECQKNSQAFSAHIETGIMIEVPSAAMTADILAEKSDFISIGTNDLVQYSLAVDRGNEKVNYLAQPLHPAVIRFLKMTIDSAHKKNIHAAICGEAAGDPGMTALLLGLDLDEFSMTSSSIPMIKKIIRELSIKDCQDLAEEVLCGKTAAMNIETVNSWMKDRVKSMPGIIQ